MTRGTTPPADARLRALEASNAILRQEAYSRRNDWRSGFVWGLVSAWLGVALGFTALWVGL